MSTLPHPDQPAGLAYEPSSGAREVPEPGAEPAVAAEPATGSGPDVGSLQALMRRARARYQHAARTSVQIPGYVIDVPEHGRGTLWGIFQALDDYSEARAINDRYETVTDPARRDLEMAVDTLLAASRNVEIRVDDVPEPISLNMPLGAELADWLDLTPQGAALTDRQAVYRIFRNTLELAFVAGKVNEFTASAGERADRELEGNSPAPSSSSSALSPPSTASPFP